MRVFILAIDGASYDLTRHLIEKGFLPNFSKMIEKGVYLKLKPTIFAHTIPSFTSIFTGINPGKHGLYEFVDSKDKTIVNYSKWSDKAIWNILGLHKKYSIVVNVPATYPAKKINGIMISGFPFPETAKEWVYPKNLKSWLLNNNYPRYGENILSLLSPLNKEEFLYKVIDVTLSQVNIVYKLIKMRKWDFFAVVFQALDWIQHFFWHHMDECHPWFKVDIERGYAKNAILKIYKLFDYIIKKLFDLLPEDTLFIVLSDHGIKPTFKFFYLNEWLRAHNLLHPKSSIHTKIITIGFTKILVKFPYKIYYIFKILRLYRLINFFLKNESEVLFNPPGLAYMVGSGIKLNIPNDHSIYEKLRSFIKNSLLKCKDEQGKNFVKNVFYREEVYSGEALDSSPDLILLLEDGYILHPLINFASILFGPPINFSNFLIRSAAHGNQSGCYGIFMAVGPEIKKGYKNSELSVMDITPTILYYLNLPISRYMDGSPALNIFKDNFRKSRKTLYVKDYSILKKLNRIKRIF